jgi:hypothetical protein
LLEGGNSLCLLRRRNAESFVLCLQGSRDDAVAAGLLGVVHAGIGQLDQRMAFLTSAMMKA